MRDHMTKSSRVISHPQQLDELGVNLLPFSNSGNSVKLDIDNIPVQQREDWEKKINERVSECGCKWAGMGFLMGTTAYLFWIALGPVKLASLSLHHLGQGIFAALAALIMGKVLGRLKGQRLLKITIAEIQQKWPATVPE